ncbi:MAG: hypothetical protein M3N14_09975 [Bacteroidota bacterium]|nr:hypothetical protein [Bacteroidota bacterium]
MKMTFMTVALIVSSSCSSYAQMNDTTSDACFYQNIIAQVGGYKSDLPIYYKTTLRTLKRVDFPSTDLDSWTAIKKTNRDFKPFLNQINVNDVKEKELISPIGRHPFTKRMFERTASAYQRFLAFSPIIYSTDKTIAVCTIFDWAEPEAASETIYLLELRAGRWEIVKFILLSIS